ncbi:MAG: sortase [Actinobacteria bacterium]|nr:sortase [Actinomycetota bacterium]
MLVFVLSVCLSLELAMVSGVQGQASQQKAFQRLRGDLAKGTTPVGPTDDEGRGLPSGLPIAYLEIPSIGLRQVIVEGTTAANLFTGPGHRRDTPLPGQGGVSVILGRRAAFGGPFSRIHTLDPGDIIKVTTGQGVYEYRVIGRRREGDALPPPMKPGRGRLLLVTADGRPFLPSGVLRVDADLGGPVAPGPARLMTNASLPAAEQIMGVTTDSVWALALWIQALILVLIGAAWAWHRWGRIQAWVVTFPVLLLVGLSASGEAARLLPNLL